MIFQIFLVTAQAAVGLVPWLGWDGCLLVVREVAHGQPEGEPGHSPPVQVGRGCSGR